MPASLKCDVESLVSGATLNVDLPIILNDRVHAVSTGMPGGFFGLAGPVWKGTHQVAHLLQGRKTAQVRVMTLAYLTDYPSIAVSLAPKPVRSMAP
jgi:hypothetical protein